MIPTAHHRIRSRNRSRRRRRCWWSCTGHTKAQVKYWSCCVIFHRISPTFSILPVSCREQAGRKALPVVSSSLLYDARHEVRKEDKLIEETRARVASHVLCLCVSTLAASSASFDLFPPSSREPLRSGHIPAASTLRPAFKRKGHVPHGMHLRIIARARSELESCSRLTLVSQTILTASLRYLPCVDNSPTI